MKSKRFLAVLAFLCAFTVPNGRIEARCVEGNCLDGTGTLLFETGSRYCGGFAGGKKHGTGVFTWIDGREFRGRFSQDQADGSGIMLLPDGRMKEVLFSGGSLLSSRYLPLNDFEGQSRYGSFNFRGEYDGWFKGNAREGFIPHGRGRMKYQNGSVYTGQWLDGKMHGNGTIRWDDGATYVGEWHHGKRKGFGIYRWANGRVYTGLWDDNNMSGHGVMNYPDGTELKGLWKEGVLSKKE